MNNQVIQDDEKAAREMQQAELGQAGGPQPIQYGYAGPQVVQGRPVPAGLGGPGSVTCGVPNAGAGFTGGYPVGGAVVVDERALIEITALRYRFSVMCFAFIDLFFICFRIAEVIVVLVQEEENPTTDTERMISPASLWWFGLLSVVFLIGPMCGFLGAKRLRRNLVSVYLIFCVGNLAHEMALAFLTVHLWLLFTAIIQLWITKIVYTFWKALGFLTPDRCEEIMRPDYTPNEPVRMVYW